jgi:hypothetical protein
MEFSGEKRAQWLNLFVQVCPDPRISVPEANFIDISSLLPEGARDV